MTSTTTPATGGTPTTHGRSTYLHHHCRCPLCTHATRAYDTARTRAIAYGTWRALVDADPVRRHATALTAAGLSWKQIATHAGVDYADIRRLLTGDSGRTPPRRIRQNTARAITSVPIPAAPTRDGQALIDATGSRRRLQALLVAGWPLRQLASDSGMTPRVLFDILHNRSRLVRAYTAAAIRVVYDHHWNSSPLDCGVRAQDVRIAQALAVRNRWAPALAWDDDQIDDPDARPDWTARCGTAGGYYDHSTIGTPTCPPCRAAVNAKAIERKMRRRQRAA